MPRPRRIQIPDGTYHVMSRGNRRASIFDTDQDRATFLALLGQTTERYDLRTYAVCLMSNHYHVVCATPRGNLSDAMRFLNGVYAQVSNRRHVRTGHLFEGRFRSLVVQRRSYLQRVVRYVVLNPVRARLVSSPEEWPWSTYRATAGFDTPPEWLCLDWLTWVFGGTTTCEAVLKYQQYVNAPPTRKHQVDTLALAFGSPAFRRRMATRSVTPVRDCLPRRFRPQLRPTLAELFSGLSLASPGIGQIVRSAHVTHGYGQGTIARHLGNDPSTISRLLKRIRERPERLS